MRTPDSEPSTPPDPTSRATIPDVDAVVWTELVDHQVAVQANQSLDEVRHRFLDNNLEFMAVLDGDIAVGLCSCHDVGMQLGSQYGFSLYAKSPIRECLVPNPLTIRPDQHWTDVLHRVFFRTGERFNEDVLLVDEAGGFLGLISVQALVRLQTRLFRRTIDRLEEQQAEISQRHRQMTDDLLMAREMQLAMLPRGLPPVVSGATPGRGAATLVSHYAPLGLVSGDFFEVLAVSDSAVGLMIADVMGHGVQAALVTAMLRALMRDQRGLAADPGAFLTAINQSLCDILDECRLAVFASAFALVADLNTGTLGYANAGHPCPILLRRRTGAALNIDGAAHSNGGVLGVNRRAVFHTGRCDLVAGDLVLLFTDGMFEIERGGGEILEPEGLLALAAKLMDLPGEALVRELVEAVRRVSPTGEFGDDVCLVGLEIAAG
ncbi:SpoIIE family protein phosphatase [Methylomagnum sp.]